MVCLLSIPIPKACLNYIQVLKKTESQPVNSNQCPFCREKKKKFSNASSKALDLCSQMDQLVRGRLEELPAKPK